jgi:hypothetical protein
VISRETIDEVKNRLDIVDVISDFISLKRSGQNYKALSPFNNEKTASFFVVPGKEYDQAPVDTIVVLKERGLAAAGIERKRGAKPGRRRPLQPRRPGALDRRRRRLIGERM